MDSQHERPDNFTSDLINRLFNHATEYEHLKEIAEKDIGKELISRIERFLESRKDAPVKEIKKIVFEDASKVRDKNINDIIDAFVKIKSQSTLNEIDNKSINDILILFNQWIALGKGQQEKMLPLNIFSEMPQSERKSLEEQITSIEELIPTRAYQSQSVLPTNNEIYSSRLESYESLGPAAQFITQEHETIQYNSRSGTLYKIH